MVLVFIFCQSVKLIPDLYEVFYCSIEPKCDSVLWIEAIIDVSHLLLAINSSCNVVIYTFSRKQFQENISDLIQRRKSKSLKKTLYFYICMTSHHIIREEKDQTKYLPSQTIIEEICRSKVVKWVLILSRRFTIFSRPFKTHAHQFNYYPLGKYLRK